MKARVSKKRFKLLTDEFEPLNEALVTTTVEANGIGVSLAVPQYDRVFRIDWWVPGAGGLFNGSAVTHVRSDIAQIQRDIGALCNALVHASEFLAAQEEPLIGRVKVREAELRERAKQKKKAQ